jgi:hypothetical protein
MNWEKQAVIIFVKKFGILKKITIQKSDTINFIVFQTKRNKLVCTLKLTIRKEEISEVKTTNFLGIDTDSSPTWEKHIDKI